MCSGPKSIIDPAATAEKLEELGVALVGLWRRPTALLPGAGGTASNSSTVSTRPMLRRRSPAPRWTCARRAPCSCATRSPRRTRWTPPRWRPRRPRRRLVPSEKACTARRGHRSSSPRSPSSPVDGASRPTSPCSRTTRASPDAIAEPAAQRSQVWMMTLEKFQPYLSDLGFFDLPPARARIVIGTSTMRAWCRSASIRISLVQN